MSYHPEHIDIDRLFAKVKTIQDVGFNIGMINFVMAPSQRSNYEEAKERFWRIGVYVNPNPYIDKERPGWIAQDYEYYKRYLAEFDLRNKAGLIDLKHTLCNFPQIGLQLDPDGTIYNACCSKKRANLFRSTVGKINDLLTESPALCPKMSCVCTYMYSFQCGQRRNWQSMETMGSYTKNALIGYWDSSGTPME